MQLLGVEFTDYACFKKRFVPIRQGVQILVGKNNAGKTAILRGLGALGGLPFVMSPKVEARLDGYCPSGGTFLSFGLNVWIAASPEVWPLIAVDHKQPPFYDPANSKLVYQFAFCHSKIPSVCFLSSCVLPPKKLRSFKEMEQEITFSIGWIRTGSFTITNKYGC